MPYLRLAMIESELEDEAESDDDDADEDLDISRIALRDSELALSAISVPHGPVPAVAYRVEVGGRSLVFAGDQNGSRDELTEFAEEADLLVLHMPIPEGAGAAGRALHAEAIASGPDSPGCAGRAPSAQSLYGPFSV